MHPVVKGVIVKRVDHPHWLVKVLKEVGSQFVKKGQDLLGFSALQRRITEL